MGVKCSGSPLPPTTIDHPPSLYQVYVGVKCISFTGVWATSPPTLALQGGLFGAVVLFINIQSWLLKRLINASTAEVQSMRATYGIYS